MSKNDEPTEEEMFEEVYLRGMVSMVAEQCGLADCVEQMIEQVHNGELEIVETRINGKTGFKLHAIKDTPEMSRAVNHALLEGMERDGEVVSANGNREYSLTEKGRVLMERRSLRDASDPHLFRYTIAVGLEYDDRTARRKIKQWMKQEPIRRH